MDLPVLEAICWETTVAGRPIIAGQFTHPAAFGKQNWANPNSAYLEATVTPALQRARAMVLGSG